MMRKIFGFCFAMVLSVLFCGCEEGQLLTVDFMPGLQQEYKIVSERKITLDVRGEGTSKGKSQEMSEKMELMITYGALGEEDEYGRTTVKAICESAKVTRKSFTGKSTPRDTVESLAGKSFVLRLSATGQIEDYSDLERVIKELGKGALGPGSNDKKVKNPDMISDFAASQWYLWDSVSKINKPGKGVVEGQSWTTEQVVPMPLTLNVAKKATYTLARIEDAAGEKIAFIDSTFEMGKRNVQHWCDPYGEPCYMKGMFAFLRGYELVSLEGSGEQVFNVSRGYIEKETQKYTSVFNVAFPMALGDTLPQLIVEQKFSLELMNSQ